MELQEPPRVESLSAPHRTQPILWVGAVVLVLLAAGAFFLWRGYAQPVAQPKTIGVIQITALVDTAVESFKQGLEERGYEEGTDVAYLYRGWRQDPALLGPIVDEYIARDVDMIYVLGKEAALAAVEAVARAGADIPVIVLMETDNLAAGPSSKGLPDPTMDVTGVSIRFADLLPRTFGILTELIPETKRIGVFGRGFISDNPNNLAYVDAIKKVGAAQGIEVIEYTTDAATVDQLEQELVAAKKKIEKDKIDALIGVYGSKIPNQYVYEVEFAQQFHIPLVSLVSEFVEIGGLFSYSPDLPTLARDSAAYADRVLRGEKASEIPFGIANEGVLVINRTTAQSLGITIPEHLLSEAVRIID